MESTDRRKHARSKRALSTLRISLEQGAGWPRLEAVTEVLDVSEQGCRVKLAHPLTVGSAIRLDRSALSGAGRHEIWSSHVVWCGLEDDGRYTAGLRFAERCGPRPQPEASAKVEEVEDYYETLQINVKADPETVHRVYRLLAQRLHPDNPETGDEKLFRRLVDAYRILSDPEQRAAFDAKRGVQNQHRWKIFDQGSATVGRAAEKVKRTAILQVLYTRRKNEPGQPAVTVQEMEDLLGCPKEHLEFSLWYLKEKGYVVRSDNGRFVISANGVEAAEVSDEPLAAERNLLSWGNSGAA